tara:strand:+ start:75 stop:701 length:627 start_codon:yes stop_codon:yes gene_type:complete
MRKLNLQQEKQLKLLINSLHFINKSKKIKTSIKYASRVYLSRVNWKSIGSGVNYNLSKFTAKRLMSELKRACAFDVLENHKHIDMSAESAILVFISNIWKESYQNDAFAEIEKMISHNSLPIIFTVEGDSRFDNFSINFETSDNGNSSLSIPVIKLPKIEQYFSFPMSVYLVEELINEMNKLSNTESEGSSLIALTNPSKENIIENIW